MKELITDLRKELMSPTWFRDQALPIIEATETWRELDQLEQQIKILITLYQHKRENVLQLAKATRVVEKQRGTLLPPRNEGNRKNKSLRHDEDYKIPVATQSEYRAIAEHWRTVLPHLLKETEPKAVSHRAVLALIKSKKNGQREDLILETQTALQEGYITLRAWGKMSKEERARALLVPDCAKNKMNEQSTDSIEWARHSWNPITGCKHDCPYCYARDFAERIYPQKFEPSFISRKLVAPAKTKVPAEAASDPSYKNVFTCSMADLFGQWVPKEWIQAVLDVCTANRQWNFLMLTKFPQRAAEFEFPKNVWMGTTVDAQVRVANAEKAFEKIQCGTKWLSVEPMLTPLKFERLDLFQWVVMGGASPSTKSPVWIPPIDWMADLHMQARAAGCRIYYKTNCGMTDALRVREFPWGKVTEKHLPSAFRYLKGL